MDYQTAIDEQELVRKTFKYKLLPTAQQEQRMAFVLRRCRELYNAALQERHDAWQKCHKRITCTHQSAQLPGIKNVRPEYHDIHSLVLQDVLSKVGRIAIRWSRPLEGKVKTVTITQEADGWYCCFSCADVPVQSLPPTGQETGIDVGLKVFLVTAEGEVVENPRHYRKAEKALQKAQRRVSRRKKGSKRRRKAVALLARKHQKVKRQRQDFHHKTALTLLRRYDVIYLEDLRVANLVRNSRLAKSISDAGWGQFRTILEGKAAYAGRRVVAVPPAYTSQDRSGCGERVEKSLSVRTHICTSCGLILDRDENAARNIQWAGQALQGAATVVAVSN